jgi:hypothetical protein
MDIGGIKLVGQHGLRPIVMDFVREGMHGATLRLRKDGLMREFSAGHPDARLIAAAPELLEALEDVLAIADTCWDAYVTESENRMTREICDRARDAISKAKGE